ncbi:MAG TPA: CPBP family intramembrane glutamic endopeptidase [Candidatus Bathyarchaeia archaeon]|nr:CPBP family intramembrane glutamic endopeptidase [Candidatus Bathyarchaeia archaeon]
MTLIFAINFGNVILSAAAGGVAIMQLAGEAINRKAGPPIRTIAKPKLGSIVTYIVLDLGLFAALDIVGANAHSLPGLPLSVLTSGNLNQILTVGALFTVQIGIAEEVFFRLGLANYGAKFGGPPLGIFTSFAAFSLFHVPADYANPLQVLIIGTDGAVMAWSDFDTASVLPSLFAHITNNLIFLLVAAVIGVKVLGL